MLELYAIFLCTIAQNKSGWVSISPLYYLCKGIKFCWTDFLIRIHYFDLLLCVMSMEWHLIDNLDMAGFTDSELTFSMSVTPVIDIEWPL